MNQFVVDKKIQIPRMLLIAGNGRNVGKTTLACRIIRYLSVRGPVIGIKISAHFHPYNEEDALVANDSFIIIEEKETNTKDSSLMLQAGAEKVYFVMAKKEKIKQAMEHLLELLPIRTLVCESGGLHQIAEPGIFLFVNRKGLEIRKPHLLEFNPVRVENDGTDFDFDFRRIIVENRGIKWKA